MPEGVEVNWMTDNINKHLVKKSKLCRLQDVEIVSGRYITHSLPKNYKDFREVLIKNKLYIKLLKSKGKFVYLTFEEPDESSGDGMKNSDWSVWITLGLTGDLVLEDDKKDHTRAIFTTCDGKFYFDDSRNFGTLTFSNDPKELEKKLASLGPDILQDSGTPHLNPNKFVEIMRGINQNKLIAMALIDQKKISGIGNYLRADILYKAKVSPFKKLGDLSDIELKRIYKASVDVVRQSFNTQNNNGLHTYNFKVYMQNKDPKGNPVEGNKLPDGRTIWWSPKVQH